jgi:hypothetical protein
MQREAIRSAVAAAVHRNAAKNTSLCGPREPVEPLRERHREQEGEEDLNAGKRDAKLVQELDELTVEPLVPVLLRHGRRLVAVVQLSEERDARRYGTSMTIHSHMARNDSRRR